MSQFWTQCVSFFGKPWTLKILLRGVFFSSFKFLWKTSQGSNLEVIKCENCLDELQSEEIKEFAILGLGRAAETLYSLARDRPITISRAYDADASKTFKDINIFPLEQLIDFDGKLVICSFNETEEFFKLAKENGIEGKRIKAL